MSLYIRVEVVLPNCDAGGGVWPGIMQYGRWEATAQTSVTTYCFVNLSSVCENTLRNSGAMSLKVVGSTPPHQVAIMNIST